MISLTGSLEYGIIETAKAKLQSLSLQTGQGYVIDLQKVTNIDSTGFGMIVNFAKKVAVQGKKIVIIVGEISFVIYLLYRNVIKYFRLLNQKRKLEILLTENGKASFQQLRSYIIN